MRKTTSEAPQGKTLGILGYGLIGQAVAARAATFGLRVVAARRGLPRPVPGPATLLSWDDVVAQADFLLVALPLTPETRGSVDARLFARMQPGSYLINIARGGVVNEAALLEALRDDHLAGAALDVFAQEPLPAESPFWTLPNVIVTPHKGWAPPQTIGAALQLFAANLCRFAAGEPLLNPVDKQRGY